MGNGKLKAVVVDAGPMIHLNEIGCISLLHIFSVLHIPDAVWSETVGQGRVSKEILIKSGIVQRHSLLPQETERFVTDHRLTDLDDGERECLCLCRKIEIPFVLTDDLAVREAAKHMNVVPIGSLGVIVKACKTGVISLSEAEKKMNDLYDVSSLYVTRTIVELAIEQLHRKQS